VQVVYTWYGSSCSPFERHAAVELAHNLVISRSGHARLETDVKDDDKYFWEHLGGKDEIKEEAKYTDKDIPEEHEPLMYVLSDKNAVINVREVSVSKSSLVSDDVCLIDTGATIYVWVGKVSRTRVHYFVGLISLMASHFSVFVLFLFVGFIFT